MTMMIVVVAVMMNDGIDCGSCDANDGYGSGNKT
jgi:hypothetical protein